ncbi:MAG: glycosyl hydrolase, partial [Vicinamibacteria bacterium]
KIGVAISPADSRRIYALIEAKEGGLYRSDDGGETWQGVNRSHALIQRAWYFMQVVPDPVNADILYALNIPLLRSVDGGKSFSAVDQFHVDNHDLWIDPKDPLHMISGNDGGANITVNGGRTWTRSDDNQPTGQFYHVATDNRFPYHVYGAQQDYETIAIASRGAGAGISRGDWYAVGGCEMGFAAPHPVRPDIVFAGCTDGGITRYDHRTRRNQSIEPWPETNIGHGASDARYRFQWTAPILISPNDPSVLYMASNVLFKSTDEGMSWSDVSPDLTRNDPETQGPAGGPLTKDNVGTEVYGTIFALAESPRQKDVLWAGSDDGLLHVTRDSGRSWTPVTPKEMPEWSRVSTIEASPHDPAAAYLAADRHLLDDFGPYLYKTSDFGKSWQSITSGLPRDTFVRSLREDPVRRGLLFAGTETGVFVSLDDGANWQPLQLNLPVSPVHDLVVKDSDLVVATHGRAFWILDDVGPLRQMNDSAADANVYLFEPTPTYRVRDDFTTIKTPAGENPPPGLIVYYTLRSPPQGELTLSILDDQGNVVDSFSSAQPGGLSGSNAYSKTSSVSTSVGLNRWVWDLRYAGPRFIPGHVLFMHAPLAPPVGALAPAGRYEVKLAVEGQTLSAPFEIRPDPRIDASAEQLRAQFELHRELVAELSALNDAVLRNRRVREQLESLRERAEKVPEVQEEAWRIEEKLTEIEDALIEPRMETASDAFNFPTRLDNKLSILIGVVANSDTAPTRPSYDLARELGERISSELGKLQDIVANDIPALNQLAQERGILAVSPGL